MSEAETEIHERVVLGRREDSFAGFSWTGHEPGGLNDPEAAEPYGAVWEDDELVTYDLEALQRMFQMDEHQSEETGYRPDND